MMWFTSDTHFGHTNIIQHCNRPFSCVEEMNESLICRWNERVAPGDLVFHLGDFAWKKRDVQNLTDRLNGRIHLVRGNHDDDKIKGRFEWVRDYHYLKLNKHYNKLRIALFHYPILSWRYKEHGTWHLHGHSHRKGPDNVPIRERRALDVGIDVFEYAPVSLDGLVDLFTKCGA